MLQSWDAVQNAILDNKNNTAAVSVYPYMTFGDKNVTLYVSPDETKNFNVRTDTLQFEEFERSVAHIVVLLQLVARGGADWRTLFANLTVQIDACVADLPNQLAMLRQLDGLPSVDGIPLPMNSTPEHIVRMAASLLNRSRVFVQDALAKGAFTVEIFQAFLVSSGVGADVLDFSYELFFLQEGRTQLVLQKWKQDLGGDDAGGVWDDLVLVTNDGATNLGPTGGLARTRGSGALSSGHAHMKPLMTAENFARNVVSLGDPLFEGVEYVVAGLKMSIQLAQDLYPTPGARAESQGMYDALVNPEALIDAGFIDRILSHFPPPPPPLSASTANHTDNNSKTIPV